jgi:flagellar FliL protein
VEKAAAETGPPAEVRPIPPPPLADLEELQESKTTQEIEVNLGEFCVTAFQPVANATLRIEFHLYGTIAQKDEEEFAQRMEKIKHRFREQVLVTLRAAEMSELTDAGLGTIKRRILDKTNRTLGKPMLRSVIFSNFSFIEQ